MLSAPGGLITSQQLVGPGPFTLMVPPTGTNHSFWPRVTRTRCPLPEMASTRRVSSVKSISRLTQIGGDPVVPPVPSLVIFTPL